MYCMAMNKAILREVFKIVTHFFVMNTDSFFNYHGYIVLLTLLSRFLSLLHFFVILFFTIAAEESQFLESCNFLIGIRRRLIADDDAKPHVPVF